MPTRYRELRDMDQLQASDWNSNSARRTVDVGTAFEVFISTSEFWYSKWSDKLFLFPPKQAKSRVKNIPKLRKATKDGQSAPCPARANQKERHRLLPHLIIGRAHALRGEG